MIRKHRTLGAIALLALAAAVPAHAASFDCSKARTQVEKRICTDPELSQLDERLHRHFAAARQPLGRGADCLTQLQRDWLRRERNACKDSACLERVYLRRLAELQALQPGAMAIRDIDLPQVPSLAWIVAPAQDRVAAPRTGTRPLVLRGRLRDAVVDGDGVVLETARGTQVVVATLLLDDADQPTLQSLAGVPGAQYEIRGQAAPGDGGFHQGQCIAIYTLPPAQPGSAK